MRVNGVSIVICCYNSAARVGETLTHALAVDTNGIACEIILVDNNSTDNTVEIARTYSGLKKIPLRVVNEPLQGLSNARAKGIAESQFELIIFCDDDNHLDKNYVQEAVSIFDLHDNVGIAGGWCRPKFSIEGREWLEDFFGALAVEKLPREEGSVNWVFGAGMVIRKDLILKLKAQELKFFLTDRQGIHQTSGGDAEWCVLARHIGYEVYYSPKMVLFHQIAERRLQKRSLMRLNRKNFHSVLHLYFLEILLKEPTASFASTYVRFFLARLKRFLVAIPQLVLSNKRALYGVEFYGNLVLMVWMIVQVRSLQKRFIQNKINLHRKF